MWFQKLLQQQKGMEVTNRSEEKKAEMSTIFGSQRRVLYTVCLIIWVPFAVVLYSRQDLLSTVNIPVTKNDLPLPGQWHEDLTTNIYKTRESTLSVCKEVTHLVYIKVPKTGSGTMTSILNQFGFKRNLTFALSKYGNHFLKEPILKTDILSIAEGKHYDLLVSHSTYNRETIREVFPKDVRIFATIRNPFTQFISAFYFYPTFRSLLPQSLRDSTNSTQQIAWLINQRYENMSKASDPTGNYQFNRLAVRLGVPNTAMFNITWVKHYIESVLVKDFEFMMIQEYFDESLILLKRYFCWKLSDVIYLSHHINTNRRTDDVYSEDLLRKHRKIALAEYLIYEYFYKKFWQTVWKEGSEFFEEVALFKGILHRIQSFCARVPPGEETLVLPSSPWNNEFAITGKWCSDSQQEIRLFTHNQKVRQNNEITKTF